MADYLVIVESPTKANTIKKFLGRSYKVEASAGHVRDLPKSKLAIDIENDFEPQYINIRGKGDLIKTLKKEAGKAKKVYLATDPDREGEAISWHLTQLLDIDANEPCRVTFNEITKNAVLEGFKNPRPIDMKLVDTYQARRVLDRIVGYKISPVLWKKVKKGLSAGRVQSVATRLICDREDEIEAFEPKEYWSITALLSKFGKKDRFEAKFHGKQGGKIEVENEEQAKTIYDEIENSEFKVVDLKKSERRRSPAPPFTTSTLQQEASRRFGFPASKTMMVAQMLYEGIDLGGKQGVTGLVTYIRTDSVRISDNAQNQALEYIKGNFGDEYVPKKKRVYKNKNQAQDAHEAIRPTYLEHAPGKIKDKLTNDQYKLYKLIYERFIASQMAEAVYDTVSVDILTSKGDYLFKASGSTLKFKGYTAIYMDSKSDNNDENEEDGNRKLPKLEVGEVLNLDKLDKKQHFTQPPPRYTEASLVKALEEHGIGRPSTYAPTISTILARGYVRREKKVLFPTELGRIVNDLLKKSFNDIVNVEFTANIEDRFDKIAEGEENWVSVIRDFYTPFEKQVQMAEEELEKVKIEDPVSDVPCDKCGRMMVYKTGRYGKFLACPGFPECRNTKPIVEEVGVDCPSCGKPLIYRKTKTGRKYVGCSNYPDCEFNSWNVPTGEKCPECGQHLEYVNRRSGTQIACSNKKCSYKMDVVENNDKG
ncbi:MAG TPA: type I DNA topoisomerase [Clostridiaceae bacterium]|nr:type I DNA topoisomerase [Clostridiaceae bacterium]